MQPNKPTKYAPLGTKRFFTGFYTSRNPLLEPGTRSESRFYGGRPDAIWSGLNVEVSADNTLIRRPGFTLFNTLPETVQATYTFRAPLQANRVMTDTSAGVYVTPATGSPTKIFTKSGGAGQTFFQGVGTQLFMSDGVDLLKWDGTHLWNWGIAAPTNAPALSITSGAPPSSPVLEVLPVGTLTGQGTLYVRTTLVTPFGETLASAESYSLVPNDQQLTVNYPTNPPANATGWNVYIGPSAGAETKQNSTPIALSVNYTQTTAISLTGAVPPGSSSGSYTITSYLGVSYVYCYNNSYTAHVSTASPVSAYTGPQTDVNVTVGGVGSSDPQVSTIQVYRTTDGGATYYLLASLANPGGGVAWSYTDTGTPDVNLNTLVIAPQALANNPPPVGLQGMCYFQGCIFGFAGNYLYFSNGPLTTNGSGNESWPPLNYALLPSAITRLVPLPTGMLIFTVDDLYSISGPGATPNLYQAGLGCLNYNAVDVSGGTVYVFTTDCNVVSITPGSGIVDLGFGIASTFESWNPAQASVAYHIFGHKDNALFVCNGAGQFVKCNPNQQPEGGAVWSTPGTVAAGLSVLSSVEVTAGVHRLLAGCGSTVIFRDWTVNADVTVPYDAYCVIGSIVLAMPGQLCEVQSVTVEALRVGSTPSVSVMLDEISGTFETLPLSVPDPPSLMEPVSLFALRYYLNQSTDPIVCHHMQLRIDFNQDTVANELLGYSLYGSLHVE